MQFSKVSIVICALALGTTLAIRAQDNPAQAAARAALAAKLFEISAQEPITNPPAAATIPVPAAVVKPTDEPPMTTVNSGDTKSQAEAEKAAKAAEKEAQKEAAKKIAAQKAADRAAAKAKAKADAAKAAADLKAQKAAAKKAAAEKAADVAAAKKQLKQNMESPKPTEATSALVESAKPAEATAVPVESTDTPAQAKAKEALANSLFQQSATPVAPASPAAPAAGTAPAPAAVATPAPVAPPMTPAKMTTPAMPVMTSPPLPISADKQQQLQALLEKYKADQLTPAEYQTQRAAILAQP